MTSVWVQFLKWTWHLLVSGKSDNSSRGCCNHDHHHYHIVQKQGTHCRFSSSEQKRGVDLYLNTKVSEEHIASIFRAEDGSSMFLWNLGIYLQVHTALLSRRPTWTLDHSENLVSHTGGTFPEIILDSTVLLCARVTSVPILLKVLPLLV
jgi:hypothetical protein